MQLFDIVHIIGATVYFVFAVLLAWLSRIPRTNPGASFWAVAIFFGLSGRLTLLLLGSLLQPQNTEIIYACFIFFGKVFFMVRMFSITIVFSFMIIQLASGGTNSPRWILTDSFLFTLKLL